MTTPRRISTDNIARAASVIDPVFLHTPQFNSEPLMMRLVAI